MTASPLITIAIPSMNQGCFLDQTLASIFSQQLPVEVILVDGGSSDNTLEVIEKWSDQLAWWRSAPDDGQAAAINEAIGRGTAPFVCWLNSDDLYLPGGLEKLVDYLQSHPKCPAVYGKAWNIDDSGKPIAPYRTREFSAWWFKRRCFISQPATLIRRKVWESVGGLDENLHLAMDYDLWWKIFKSHGALAFIPEFVASNRIHGQSKTSSQRRRHYLEAMAVLRRHTGTVPLKWFVAWPWSVWLKSRKHAQRT